MPHFTDSQITGNLGESFIAYKLSKYCLVRLVTGNTDSGIDLYCETLVNSPQKDGMKTPFLHFWVQVKTRANGKFPYPSPQDYWYYERQPVPVFLFFINLTKPFDEERFCIKVLDITEKLIHDKITANTEKKEVKRFVFSIKNENELQDFINKTVPSSTSRKQLSRGILSKLPTIENEYVKQVLPDNSYGFLYEMLDAIRYTSHAISDIEKNGSRAHGREELDEQRRHLAAILETYTKQRKWRGKWEIHYNLGISNELDKQPEKAIEYYKNALKIIEEDKNVEGHPCFQAYIDELKTRIRQLESKLGHE